MKFEPDKEEYLIIGLFIGMGIILGLWFVSARLVEESKIADGYLTHESKRYTVTLYDTLETPEKGTKAE